jgi:hypothetical protein
MWEQVHARQEHLLREAEIDRLLTAAQITHSSLQARVLARLGSFLMFCGERLGASAETSDAAPSDAAALPAGQPTDWRILADGTLVPLAPGAPIEPEAGAPLSVIVRLDHTPEGRVSLYCWNAESSGERGEASERQMALFYLSEELAPAR